MPATNRSFLPATQPLVLEPPFAGVTSSMEGGAPAPAFGCSALDNSEQGWIVDSTGSLTTATVLITPCFTISPGVFHTAFIDIRVIAVSGPQLSLELQTCAGVILDSGGLSTAPARSIQQVTGLISTGDANVRLALTANDPTVELSVFSLVLTRNS